MKDAENEFSDFIDKQFFGYNIKIISNFLLKLQIKILILKIIEKTNVFKGGWVESVKYLETLKEKYIEIGPGKVLSGQLEESQVFDIKTINKISDLIINLNYE